MSEIMLGQVYALAILFAGAAIVYTITRALWSSRHREYAAGHHWTPFRRVTWKLKRFSKRVGSRGRTASEPGPDEIVVEWLYVMPDEASYPAKDEVRT